MALGLCTDAGGALRQPNRCNDLTCENAGNGEGICAMEAGDMYCDGTTQADGRGIATCTDDVDCSSIGPEWGNCTITEQKRCFRDPIVASGLPGQSGGVLVTTACVPPSGDNFSEGAFGFPGAARLKLGVDYATYCADGVTRFELGGSVCLP
jgi:hypothetical protein